MTNDIEITENRDRVRADPGLETDSHPPEDLLGIPIG